MTSSAFFALALLLPAVVSAANDWKTPCLNGTCSYDLHNGTAAHGVAGGSVYLNGSTNAISDLTEAAGWTILDCDASASAQNIRAVCTGANSTCSHLYNNGAVGTIVRLPESCGTMPFARIASEYTSDDQSVPDAVALKLRRRDDEPASTVRGITLDTNFKQIDPKHHGSVAVFLRGATGVAATTVAVAPPQARGLAARGWFDDLEGDVSGAINDIESTFTYSNTSSIPISESHTFTLWSKNEQCALGPDLPTFSAGAKLTATVKANATLEYGIVLAGTIVPPEVTQFELVAGLDAKLDAILAADISATVALTTGKLALFSVGLPGLDFPGILTIGPSFAINADATAQIGADAQFSVDLSYTATGAKLYFPDNSGSSWGNFAPSGANIALSANPTISATGSINAHLIPTISFGVNALDGIADVNINLNLDATAGITTKLSKSFSGTEAFTGCADVSAGFSVNAAADGDFFSLFKENESVPLYTKTWDLWKKCLGQTRREHARDVPHWPRDSTGITCPGNANGTRTAITNSTIPATTIQANQTSSSS